MNNKSPKTEEEFDEKWNPVYFKRVSETHNSPSSETRERLSILETNQCNIMEKLNEYQQENRDQHKELKDMIEKALASKSDIWVEKAFTWLLYTVGGIVVTALMYLIIIK